MKLKTKRNLMLIKKWGKEGIYMVIGCAIMAMGTALFLLPNKLSSGGFTGIATIIYYLSQMPLGATMVIINIPLFIMAFVRVLACIYGGICIGIGTAIILKAHASTGGTDMLSYIIRSYRPQFRAGNLIVIVDTIIVFLNVMVFKQIEIGLYSAIAIYIMGKMIDIIFEGIYFTKNMFIVSNQYKEISKQIEKTLDRSR